MKGGTIERGYIGVQLQPGGTINEDTAAALGIPVPCLLYTSDAADDRYEV
ncbi:hypothetical protein [Sphingomonas faeni]|nr:hypothetical protein [Sphingomonas faeni]MCK8458708.1 hypothetical protein [Sphingomonas faeni]